MNNVIENSAERIISDLAWGGSLFLVIQVNLGMI